MLTLESATVRFGGRAALDAVDLKVAEHEIVCVLGPSGSGKSTLLRVVAGLHPPDDGRVLLDGADQAGVPVHRRGLGLMFQDHQLFPHRDVGANVAFGLRIRGVSRRDQERRVGELLDLVGLPGAERRAVAALSGGEQQRVALARALAPSPKLLMLDEPLGQLDRGLRERLVVELRTLFGRLGTTVLAVTHDQGEAFALADRVVVMRDGRIAQVGTPLEVWQRPASAFVARFLGFDNVVGATVSGTVADTVWGKVPVPGARRRGRAICWCALPGSGSAPRTRGCAVWSGRARSGAITSPCGWCRTAVRSWRRSARCGTRPRRVRRSGPASTRPRPWSCPPAPDPPGPDRPPRASGPGAAPTGRGSGPSAGGLPDAPECGAGRPGEPLERPRGRPRGRAADPEDSGKDRDMTESAREGIDITRILDAPPEKVFAAWTTPEHFAAWYGGDAEVPLDRVSMDVRPGGAWSLVIVVPGTEMPFHGVYREVVAPEKLVFTLKDASAPADIEGETVTATFTERRGGTTELVFQQRGGNLTAEQYAAAEDGWEAFFDALVARLASF